ncbi:cell wall hydrolase (endolysin) [[Clostridium] sordellii]|uniref:N-acetylmuramoyl-L-alanine amidase n=1 Tax=Paraclostridium sordellii TaxID=1505 RepID=UPI0005E87828|nr:N-acetylmuramoyl-L-alanine amidase [Paeniclostridium sordellii]CEP50263.1 cell wall hydrolase (endolysin) [[Clostridium] sordellii] [Paeniclostridium sordellii]
MLNSFNTHGGHDAQGKGASGACAKVEGIGWFYESVEDRNVKNDLNDILRHDYGKTVYDCTVDAAGTQQANLSQIVAKCNAHKVDRDISIHFNSGRDDENGDGDNAGVEVWLYDNSDSQLIKEAERICANISKLGFDNRGVKFDKKLYVLRNTHAKAMLIECCFVDDKDDVVLYKKVGSKAIAKAIAEGILGTTINNSNNNSSITTNKNIDVTYQVYASGKWLPNVTNLNDYAGIFGKPIQAIYASLSEGSIRYRVHTIDGKWLPWVNDRQDYAGILSKNIDGLQMQLVGLDNYSVQYRAYVGGRWLPWVTDLTDYAGIYGKPIEGIQVQVIKK